jgi:hypothetical protein
MTEQEAREAARKVDTLLKHQDEPEGYYWIRPFKEPVTGYWRLEICLEPWTRD